MAFARKSDEKRRALLSGSDAEQEDRTVVIDPARQEKLKALGYIQ